MGQQDWNQLGKHLFKPNAPVDARELVNSDDDIVNIDSAYVGMIVTVNSNPIQRYRIKKVTWEGHPDSFANGGYELIKEPKDLKYSDGTSFLNNDGNIGADYLKLAEIDGSEEKSIEDDFNVKTDTLRIDGTTYGSSKKEEIRTTIGAQEDIISMSDKLPVVAALNNRPADIVPVTGEVKALGYKVLNPALSFASQVTNGSNTVFEIKDSFENVGTSQTPFEMADNSTIKFNGGKISGKIIGNNLRVIGYVEDKTAFPNGYNLNDSDYLVASEIGMIPDDSIAAEHNGSVLDAVISKQKNLIIDKYYYFDSGHEFDYPLELTGNGAIDTTSGDSEGFLIPQDGAAIRVNGLSLNLYNSFGSGFIKSSNCNFLISFIEFLNCTIKNGRPCNIDFIDYNATINHWGVDRVLISNNILEDTYNGFMINNCVIWKSCLVKNNTFNRLYSVGFSHAINNEYILSSGNIALECDIIIDGNILDNTGYIAENENYVSLILVESRKCIYTNNSVINVINLSNNGTAYDTYANCAQFDYINNTVFNLLCIPKIPTSDDTSHNTIADSKRVPSISDIKTYRIIKGNVWRIDYDFIRNQISLLKNTTYTDEVWDSKAKINIAYTNNVCDLRIVDGNIFESNGTLMLSGRDIGGFKNIEIFNNTITCAKLTGWYSSDSTLKISVKNNVYKVSDSSSVLTICGYQGEINKDYIEVIGNKSNISVKLAYSNTFVVNKLLFKDNEFKLSSAYINCIDKTSMLVHSEYTNGIENLYIPTNCNTIINTQPVIFTNNGASGKGYFYKYNDNTKFVLKLKSVSMGVDTSVLVDITKGVGEDDTMVIKDRNLSTVYEGVVGVDTQLLYYAYGEFKIVNYGNGVFVLYVGARASKTVDCEVEFLTSDTLQTLAGNYFLAKGVQRFYGGIPQSYNGTEWTDMLGIKTNRHAGTTTQRPISTAVGSGAYYFDTTIKKPIFWNGSSWIDANGETVGLQVSDKSVLIGAAADSSATINVYHANVLNVLALNPDNTLATWLTVPSTIAVGTNTLIITANSANSTNPRGAKIVIEDGTDVVIVNVVQNYSTT